MGINISSSIRAFKHLSHSIILHSQDVKPHWETWRVKPTVSIERWEVQRTFTSWSGSCRTSANFSLLFVFHMDNLKRSTYRLIFQRGTSPLPEILHWDWSAAWFPWSCSPSLRVHWEWLCFLRIKIWMKTQHNKQTAKQMRKNSWTNSSPGFSHRKRVAHFLTFMYTTKL